MEKKMPNSEVNSNNEITELASTTVRNEKSDTSINTDSEKSPIENTDSTNKVQVDLSKKKSIKPPKLEDKPFEEFITNHLIPLLKTSINDKGTLVKDIRLIEGNRPVVGGHCWMVFCEISDQRRFWLCFNNNIISSDKTILLAESNSDPSIVESFLIDEKKTTLPLLISRVLQRLNGQKWIGAN